MSEEKQSELVSWVRVGGGDGVVSCSGNAATLEKWEADSKDAVLISEQVLLPNAAGNARAITVHFTNLPAGAEVAVGVVPEGAALTLASVDRAAEVPGLRLAHSNGSVTSTLAPGDAAEGSKISEGAVVKLEPAEVVHAVSVHINGAQAHTLLDANPRLLRVALVLRGAAGAKATLHMPIVPVRVDLKAAIGAIRAVLQGIDDDGLMPRDVAAIVAAVLGLRGDGKSLFQNMCKSALSRHKAAWAAANRFPLVTAPAPGTHCTKKMRELVLAAHGDDVLSDVRSIRAVMTKDLYGANADSNEDSLDEYLAMVGPLMLGYMKSDVNVEEVNRTQGMRGVRKLIEDRQKENAHPTLADISSSLIYVVSAAYWAVADVDTATQQPLNLLRRVVAEVSDSGRARERNGKKYHVAIVRVTIVVTNAARIIPGIKHNPDATSELFERCKADIRQAAGGAQDVNIFPVESYKKESPVNPVQDLLALRVIKDVATNAYYFFDEQKEKAWHPEEEDDDDDDDGNDGNSGRTSRKGEPY